ncbi:uncharacterized protein [Eucyclogobius newberryi]|uniref:uncharacterized protein n=1 Tax=Eucyclogobius newberryi TaxID=166745 RepID=UPI003B5C52B8
MNVRERARGQDKKKRRSKYLWHLWNKPESTLLELLLLLELLEHDGLVVEHIQGFMMTSGITSSYDTIQSAPEDPGTTQASGDEDGQETIDTIDISLNPESSTSPGPSDEQETSEDVSRPSETTQPALSDDGESDQTPEPVPLPRAKIHLDVPENQSSTEETSSETPPVASAPEPAPEPAPGPAPGPLAPSNSLRNIEVKRSSSFPRPKRPPPPTGYYGSFSSAPKPTSMSSDNENSGESVAPAPTDEHGTLFGTYRSMDESQEKPAVPPRPPQPKQPYVSSASLTSQMRPPPPAFSPPPPPTDTEPLYSEIQLPAYLHILPEHDNNVAPEKPALNSTSRSGTKRTSMALTQVKF